MTHLPDKLKSRDPMADTILETSRGTMRDLSILKNSSPGYWKYMTSRRDHSCPEARRQHPRMVPATTPMTVSSVRRFSLTNEEQRFLRIWSGIVVDVSVDKRLMISEFLMDLFVALKHFSKSNVIPV